jgi:hypothetical protein
VPSRFRPLLWPLVVVVFAVSAYALLRYKREEGLVDFVVPRTAAARALAHEPLYRDEDGHYQYKYLPAFAFVMVPFTWPPEETAEAIWFALTVAMTWALVRLSIRALPDRRLSLQTLVWLTLLLNGKFLVKELAFGQFNLPLALLLIGALIAAQKRRAGLAGALAGAAVFVKPYALVLAPWLVITQGPRALVAMAAAGIAGLALPVTTYGWDGNIALLQDWYRHVTATTAPNLMVFENISFASMWAKWLEPGNAASRLALVTSALAFGTGLVLLWRRRGVPEPNYLECSFFFLLIPLLSPQGWDYVLLVAMPAYMLLVDRWRDTPWPWRAIAAAGFILTSFAIYDVFGRALYFKLMGWGAQSVGALLMCAALVRMRWRGVA